jgi:hypothetical protein
VLAEFQQTIRSTEVRPALLGALPIEQQRARAAWLGTLLLIE